MFKAINIQDNTEIVILDSRWHGAIKELRQLDHQNLLVCQGCKQPVRVRAGGYRRKHFAHKHLNKCSYSEETSDLLNARATLYEWLVSKFGKKVTIEKTLEKTALFRPVDCWVEQDQKVFAYWIFGSVTSVDKRKILLESFAKLGVVVHWIFVSKFLKGENEQSQDVKLSKIERDFIKPSEHDLPISRGRFTGGTLHYLDTQNHTMTTLRSLYSIHGPNIYSAHTITSSLDQLLISPKNGEFIHEGENDQLQAFKQEEKKLKETQNNPWNRYAFQNYPNLEKQPPKEEKSLNTGLMNPETHGGNKVNNSQDETPTSGLLHKKAPCMFCGTVTDKWWNYDGATGQCQCDACYQQGKFKITK